MNCCFQSCRRKPIWVAQTYAGGCASRGAVELGEVNEIGEPDPGLFKMPADYKLVDKR
jgi:hypothetical protein